MMKWVVLLPVLLLFQGIYAQSIPSHPVDEIISYDMEDTYGKTEFVVFQYGDEGLVREGSITHHTRYTGWFSGDIDGDGVDEVIAYNNEGDDTHFIFFQHDGTMLVKEGETTHYTKYIGWSAGDIDGDGVDEVIASEVEGDTTHFIFFQYDGTLVRDGEVKRVPESTGWFAGDIDVDGVDEIVTYDMEDTYGKTEFAVFQYRDEEFLREGSITHYTQYAGWLAGDFDGDGVDEAIAYNTEGYATRFIFFQYDGKTLVRESDATHSTQHTGWFTGDTDEALSLVSYFPSNTALKLDEGETLTFSIGAEQSDGASVSYSWELDDTKVATSNEWSYDPDYESPGLYTVVGSATDGKLSVSKEWQVNVGEANRAPTVTLLSPESGDILAGDADITWKASDPNGDKLTIEIAYSSDGGQASKTLTSGEENDGIFTWDTGDVNDGEYILKIVASDPYGLFAENLSGSIFIENTLPEVEFISPDAGEVEGTRKVAWQVSDLLYGDASVVLSLSSDGGKTWKTLTSGEGSGSFSWNTEEVPDGKHILRLVAESKAGKSEQTLKVTVYNPDYGSFYVSSTPQGASIIIGGKDFGETNKEVKLLVGYHTIELRKEGHASWSDWIEVKKGQNPDINVRLIPTIFGLPPVYIFMLVLGVLLLAGIVFLYFKIKKK